MKHNTNGLTRGCLQHGRMLARLTGLTVVTLSLIQLPAQAQYSPPTSGLVAWWRGEGNANDSADSHNGTLQGGMGFTTGMFGQAFAGGSNQRVFVPDSPAFQLSSFSMGAWINIDSLSHVVLFRGDTRTGFDPFMMGLDANNGNFVFSITDTNNASVGINSSPLPLHQWLQVTSTFDASNGDMRLYTNGVLAAETFTAIRPILALNTADQPGIDIGNVDPSNDFPFLGAIDEVVLYNRALSPGELTSLVPEPGSAALLCIGAGLFCALNRRRSGKFNSPQ